ncbi:hypothetical protein [Vibrio harveyi]|uniref:hypothetical protein n=1 Tax=Vibrio harveyi TaxID=669 RepID=UPI003CF12857
MDNRNYYNQFSQKLECHFDIKRYLSKLIDMSTYSLILKLYSLHTLLTELKDEIKKGHCFTYHSDPAQAIHKNEYVDIINILIEAIYLETMTRASYKKSGMTKAQLIQHAYTSKERIQTHS